ncbi:MAG: hypothetical protein ABIH76_07425 [Candidatus Bathyarchaeota archaeon]
MVVSKLGKVSAGTGCSVEDCTQTAIRSISVDKAKSAGLKIGNVKRAYLCKEHYKALKKSLKKEKLIEKWRHMG